MKNKITYIILYVILSAILLPFIIIEVFINALIINPIKRKFLKQTDYKLSKIDYFMEKLSSKIL